MLEYLAEKHQKFLPTELKAKFNVLRWCYFQVAHIGPMFGQYGHFHRYAKEDVPYAKKRYEDEVNRLMGVMDKQLTDNLYISGSDYTIADMAIWPWIYCYENFYQGKLDVKRFPHLTKWYHELGRREAMQATLAAYQD